MCSLGFFLTWYFSLLVDIVASIILVEEFGTHKVVQQGLSALGCMEHRGACGGDSVSGDGAGIMTEIPWKLFDEFRSEENPHPGVGMMFLPRDEGRRNKVKAKIEQVLKNNELELLGWREVPVDPDVLGPMARDAMPSIWQLFVKAPERLANDDDVRDGFERTLYLVRRRFSVELREAGLTWDDDDGEVYVASLSSRTIVYKGMVQSEVLPQFYKDLTDPNYTSKFVIYHRRFSTNTNPKWPLAQPMRVVGHNGEWIDYCPFANGRRAGHKCGGVYERSKLAAPICNHFRQSLASVHVADRQQETLILLRFVVFRRAHERP